MSETIHVVIMSPEEIVWQGEAEALSSENTEGPFDILPEHANFMTLIKDTDIVLHLADEKERSFSFNQAVLFFHENTAKIYIHVAPTSPEKK